MFARYRSRILAGVVMLDRSWRGYTVQAMAAYINEKRGQRGKTTHKKNTQNARTAYRKECAIDVLNHSIVYICCLLMWCLQKLLSFAFHTISLLVPLWILAFFILFAPNTIRRYSRSTVAGMTKYGFGFSLVDKVVSVVSWIWSVARCSRTSGLQSVFGFLFVVLAIRCECFSCWTKTHTKNQLSS